MSERVGSVRGNALASDIDSFLSSWYVKEVSYRAVEQNGV